MAAFSPHPDKTIRVTFRPDVTGRQVIERRQLDYTGQIRIRDGVLVVYEDLPGGDFFTIAGIPLGSVLIWEEVRAGQQQ